MENKLLSFRMQLFASVIRAGSFTVAADQLNLTKSGLSQHITALEQELGVQLMHRTTRKLTLSHAGERFFQRCVELENLLRIAVDELNETQSTICGGLTLTAPEGLVRPIISPVVIQLMAKHPELTIDLIVSDKQLDLIQGNIDVAIRAGKLVDSSSKARKIGEVSEYWYVNKNIICNESLAEIVLPWQNSSSEKQLKVSTFPAAIEFVIQGAGIALLPDIAVLDFIDNGTLIRIDHPGNPGLKQDKIPVYAIHNYQNHTPRNVQYVIAAIEEALKKLCTKLDIVNS
ncbi:LysR family transcriptional regulator [Veronia pacifica]|uniref:HTH lysR-type domain-containing protein n=1 Tax=Veronia pacifica TaxID=1080227 RepID=A0A1C3EKV9_9GAMM|nr:LysR family transcriptional regulator [Veronia pacifica]ODA33860.1 hypothetical protein A8L45_08515 [Veronia pacifica]